MNSREATLDGDKVVVELKAMPIPIPKTNTPPKIAMVVKLKREDCNGEDLELLLDLVGVRLIVAGLPSRLR